MLAQIEKEWREREQGVDVRDRLGRKSKEEKGRVRLIDADVDVANEVDVASGVRKGDAGKVGYAPAEFATSGGRIWLGSCGCCLLWLLWWLPYLKVQVLKLPYCYNIVVLMLITNAGNDHQPDPVASR